MKTKKYFLFLFFLLLIPFVYSVDFNCTEALVNETFDFDDVFSIHYQNESGWVTSNPVCIGSSAPLNNSPFGDGGYYGVNITNNACGSYQSGYLMFKFDPQNITNTENLIISYDLWYKYASNYELNYIQQRFFLSTESYVGAYTGFRFTPYVSGFPDESVVAGLNWGVSNLYFEETIPIKQNYTWIIDMGTGYYDLYVDDVLVLDDYDMDLIGKSINKVSLFNVWYDGNSENYGVDNLLVCASTPDNPITNNSQCDFPIVFCDDFNYEYPIKNEGWNTYKEDLSIINKEPDNWELKWYSTDMYKLSHTYDPFTTSFPQPDGYTTETGVYAPKFTVEFDMKITDNTSANFSFQPLDDSDELCYNMEFVTNTNNGINISVGDISSGAQSVKGSMTENTTHTIKLVHRFTHLNKSYEFNTSVTQNLLDIYVDSSSIKKNIPFNVDCWNIYEPTFIMNTASTVVIDDYYAYVGTDKQTSTIPNDYIPVSDTPYNDTTITSGQYDTADLKQTIDNLWDDFGMSTTGSKILFGIMMLIIICMFAIGFMVSAKIFSFPALLAICGLVMILEVFMGLLPIWLFGLMALIGGGIGILAIKMMIA